MYLERALSQSIKKAARQFPVILVTGARQVGKSTLLQHLAADGYTKITLDDPLILELAKRDPALLLQRYKAPLLIDEIQYAPELLPLIKMAVDVNPQNGQYWLTGSQQFHLMKGVTESLAGRVGVLSLYGFSLREAEGNALSQLPFIPTERRLEELVSGAASFGISELFQRIWKGSYPRFLNQEDGDKDLFYSSYVQTYLQRDVRDLARVGDEGAFLRFLKSAAARTGQILNYADLAKDVGIAPNTIKAWISILETSGIIYLMPAWHANVGKQLTKAPKLHFLDTGLCSWLTGWSSPEVLEQGAFAGHILESWVVGQILRSFRHNGKSAPLYHYRDAKKNEIDLLIQDGDTLYPIEIKKTATPSLQDAVPMKVLDTLSVPVGEKTILCSISSPHPLTATLTAFPLSLL